MKPIQYVTSFWKEYKDNINAISKEGDRFKQPLGKTLKEIKNNIVYDVKRTPEQARKVLGELSNFDPVGSIQNEMKRLGDESHNPAGGQ